MRGQYSFVDLAFLALFGSIRTGLKPNWVWSRSNHGEIWEVKPVILVQSLCSTLKSVRSILKYVREIIVSDQAKLYA